MPILDGTGPKGEGPKTGRGLGKCDDVKTTTEETNTATPGRGLGQNKPGNGRNSNRGNA